MRRHFFLLVFVLVGSAYLQNAHAVHSANAITPVDPMVMAPSMTVNDFLDFDYKGYRNADGKRLKWTQRLAIGMTQKKLARKVRKGKMEGSASLVSAIPAAGNNTHGLLSVIFAFAGLVIPYLGFGLIVAGLVLGIIGIKKDYNPTLAIIGTVVNGIFLLLVFLVLVLVASGAWFWF